jgi:hypothetical protein
LGTDLRGLQRVTFGSDVEDGFKGAPASARSTTDAKPVARLNQPDGNRKMKGRSEQFERAAGEAGFRGLIGNQATEHSIGRVLVANPKPCHLTVTKESAVAPDRKAPQARRARTCKCR